MYVYTFKTDYTKYAGLLIAKLWVFGDIIVVAVNRTSESVTEQHSQFNRSFVTFKIDIEFTRTYYVKHLGFRMSSTSFS